MARKPESAPAPAPNPLERTAIVGILAGVVLSAGVNMLTTLALDLPVVALFGTFFIAAFGGYASWIAVQRWDVGQWTRTRGGVFAWCLGMALISALAYTLAVGALGIALDDGPAANMIMLPLNLAAFLVLRRWLRSRGLW